MDLADTKQFLSLLYERMCLVNPGIERLALYEFRYCLTNITPVAGWKNIVIRPTQEVEAQISDLAFFKSIQFKPIQDGKIVLDDQIMTLTQMLLAGLVHGDYSIEWLNTHFYFDIRAFVFLVRTPYYNQQIFDHFGGKPCFQFEQRQSSLAALQDLGYREFSLANQQIDTALIQTLEALIAQQGTPLILTLVGPTGAGKTEIIQRMRGALQHKGLQVGSIEMDNFYKDGSFREGKPLDKHLIHYEIFLQSMQAIRAGKEALIPRYNFLTTTSSHDLNSQLRAGQEPLLIQPADVIFLEGNYPFHQPDVAPLVGTKIVYLTDDAMRLQRKWRRDIDYRKKYDPVYFVNRYFRTQFIRAAEVYRPLMQACDVLADTSQAALWLTSALQQAILPTINDIRGEVHA